MNYADTLIDKMLYKKIKNTNDISKYPLCITDKKPVGTTDVTVAKITPILNGTAHFDVKIESRYSNAIAYTVNIFENGNKIYEKYEQMASIIGTPEIVIKAFATYSINVKLDLSYDSTVAYVTMLGEIVDNTEKYFIVK